MSAGDFSFDGVLTRSRAHVTASRDRRAPVDRGAHRRAAAADHRDLLQLRRLGVALVLEELVRAEHERPRRPPARRRPRSSRSGAASSSVVATDATLRRAPGERGRGAAHAVDVELVGVADAHEHRGLGPELARGRHRERLAQLALEAGLGEERGEPAAERARRRRRAGSELAVGEHGDGEQVDGTRSAGVDEDRVKVPRAELMGLGLLTRVRRSRGGHQEFARRAVSVTRAVTPASVATTTTDFPRRRVAWSDDRSPRHRPPVSSGASHPFLDALRERVLVFDGAFGTWMQGHDLGPDDFGGAALEGCNEISCSPGPTSWPRCTTSTSRSASTRSRPPRSAPSRSCSTSTTSPDKTFEINEHAARDRPRGRADVLHARPAPLRDRLDRPRHQAPVARPHPLRRCCATTTRRRSTGCSRAASTCCSSRPSTTCSRRRPRSTAPARAMRAAGVLLPIMVQVTVETTGRMLVGSEIGAALTALEAMQPDVIGMNCATGPAEMTEHLRYLAQHARTFLSCLPERGLAVGRRRPHALRPHARRRSPTRTSGSSPSSA